MKNSHWVLFVALAGAILVYANGLNGPFLLDDYVHIAQNRWVKIDSLDWSNLVRAWNSSFSPFPVDRPLAQLSFGLNHVFSGLDPWAYKATNLVIHLVSGLMVYLLSRLILRAVSPRSFDSPEGQLFAAAAAAFWLLHPMHVSTVLYTVQRMAQISTLGLLSALSCYFWGRIRIADGRHGVSWILAAVPVSMIGFLGKENAALLPLLLLVSELTVLQAIALGDKRTFIHTIWILFIAVPLIAACTYFAMSPEYFYYDRRPFTLEERVLTQARVLWLYIQWLFVPDISAFGLFHDDIEISTGLTRPPSTLAAIIALMVVTVVALVQRRKAPVFAFSVLFFLASHALESSVFPLEMVFEHRNYLASVGPLIFLAYLITVSATRMNVRALALTLSALLLLSYSVVTYTRVGNWSSYQRFAMSTAEHHPASARSNFMAAQVLISALDNSEAEDVPVLAQAAQQFLNSGLEADSRCINCLFGMLVLDLYQDRQPTPALITRLADSLRSGHVGPTKVSITQITYLVKWQQSSGFKLDPASLEAIFEAALENPAWNNTGRAGIATAYREYYELVVGDPAAALPYANIAVSAWPEQWTYHMNLVSLLAKMGHWNEALKALDGAAKAADNEEKQQKTSEVRAKIALKSQN